MRFTYAYDAETHKETVNYLFEYEGKQETVELNATYLIDIQKPQFDACGYQHEMSKEEILEALLLIKANRDKMKSSHEIKSLDGWEQTPMDFTEYVAVGETVDETLYDHFLEVMPPRSWSRGYLQMGEPYSHIERDGKTKGTYLTFYREGDNYIYAGLCFPGEKENVVDYVSTLDRRIRQLEKELEPYGHSS